MGRKFWHCRDQSTEMADKPAKSGFLLNRQQFCTHRHAVSSCHTTKCSLEEQVPHGISHADRVPSRSQWAFSSTVPSEVAGVGSLTHRFPMPSSRVRPGSALPGNSGPWRWALPHHHPSPRAVSTQRPISPQLMSNTRAEPPWQPSSCGSPIPASWVVTGDNHPLFFRQPLPN